MSATNKSVNLMEKNTDICIQDPGNGQVWLTINRATKHNALSRAVLAELAATVIHYGNHPTTRFIIIQGAGDRYFAAGGDLVDLSTVRTPDATEEMSKAGRDALDALRNCPVPVVAYLTGDAIGGGAELALACDMRMIAASARIGFIQAKLSITPAWGGATDLCALVGPSRALRMMSRCEMISAETALDWGLADAIINDGPAGHDVANFLEPLLRRSTLIMRALKAQTRAWRTGHTYVQQRELELQSLITSWTHEDHWAAADHILLKKNKT